MANERFDGPRPRLFFLGLRHASAKESQTNSLAADITTATTATTATTTAATITATTTATTARLSLRLRL